MKLCRSTGTVGAMACNRSQASAVWMLMRSMRPPVSVTSGKQLAMLHIDGCAVAVEGATIEGEAAEYYVVDVHSLDQAIDGGARRLNLGGIPARS